MGISGTAAPRTKDGKGTYAAVTQQILSMLERGVVPWRRPWSVTQGEPPMNVRGNQYRGANYFLLGALGYERPVFLTFRQAHELGGHVRRGEKGWPVVYWKMLEAKDKDDDKVEKEGRAKPVPFLRYFTVFNIAQCEGLTLPANIAEKPEPPTFDPIQAAETIWANYQNPPTLQHHGNWASYSIGRDEITMPQRHAFDSPEEYYSALFHEAGHSTGHQTRLDRDLGLKHGTQAYSREELVAEMCAAFLCARAGISRHVIENQASYLAHWSRALTDDPKLFVTAAGKAQKAADWILGANGASEAEQEEQGECA